MNRDNPPYASAPIGGWAAHGTQEHPDGRGMSWVKAAAAAGALQYALGGEQMAIEEAWAKRNIQGGSQPEGGEA